MADKNTIKDWFRTGLKPTQPQFWATWDSFWHKDEKIPITAIDDIGNILNAKAEAEVLTDHLTDPNAHAESIGMKTDKGDYEGTSEDLDSRIAAIENPDRVLKFGTITVTGLNIDIASNAFSWVLNKQEFLTPAVFTDTLDATTAGMYRSDVVVGNQAGGYDIITGDEASTGAGATEKAPPAGTIRLGYVFLQGNTVLGSGSAPAEEKSTIIDADRIVFDNSQNSYAKASIKLSNFKTVLKAWLDSFFKDRYVTIVDNVTTAYTLQLSDGTKNTLIRHNNASAITETIPANATVAFPIGTEIKSISIGVGLRTVTPAAGVTILNHVSLTSAQNQMMRFIKTATNTWVVTGDVGFEKDIKLSNYPSTRNDGQLPTNKVLAPDVNGNIKLYTIATAPAPFMEILIPDSTLTNTTTNFTIKGAFFTPTMTVAIVGQVINYVTFVSDNKILVNVTTGAVAGMYDVTLNNGLTAIYSNALLLTSGIIYKPNIADWTVLSGSPDLSVEGEYHISIYNATHNVKWNKAFDYTRNFQVFFRFKRSPTGSIGDQWGQGSFSSFVVALANAGGTVGFTVVIYSSLYCFHMASSGTPSGNLFYQASGTATEKGAYFETQTISYKYISGVMYLYLNNTLRATYSLTITENLFLNIKSKTVDVVDIKYIELP